MTEHLSQIRALGHFRLWPEIDIRPPAPAANLPYEASQQAVMDALGKLAVPERCVRHPPGWVFEVAEIVAGPLKSFDGLPFFVVRIDIKDTQSLYGLTWRRLGETAPKGQPF